MRIHCCFGEFDKYRAQKATFICELLDVNRQLLSLCLVQLHFVPLLRLFFEICCQLISVLHWGCFGQLSNQNYSFGTWPQPNQKHANYTIPLTVVLGYFVSCKMHQILPSLLRIACRPANVAWPFFCIDQMNSPSQFRITIILHLHHVYGMKLSSTWGWTDHRYYELWLFVAISASIRSIITLLRQSWRYQKPPVSASHTESLFR